MQNVNAVYRAAQYDGTAESAAEIKAMGEACVSPGSTWVLDHANATDMLLNQFNAQAWGNSNASPNLIKVGQWVIFGWNGMIDLLDDPMFQLKWAPVS